MVAKTLTISIPAEDYEYLASDGLLSPSKIFQVALANIKENRKSFEEKYKRQEKVMFALQRRVFAAEEVLKEHSLIDEWEKKCEIKI